MCPIQNFAVSTGEGVFIERDYESSVYGLLRKHGFMDSAWYYRPRSLNCQNNRGAKLVCAESKAKFSRFEKGYNCVIWKGQFNTKIPWI